MGMGTYREEMRCNATQCDEGFFDRVGGAGTVSRFKNASMDAGIAK